jgi:hypothetical protein
MVITRKSSLYNNITLTRLPHSTGVNKVFEAFPDFGVHEDNRQVGGIPAFPILVSIR